MKFKNDILIIGESHHVSAFMFDLREKGYRQFLGYADPSGKIYLLLEGAEKRFYYISKIGGELWIQNRRLQEKEALHFNLPESWNEALAKASEEVEEDVELVDKKWYYTESNRSNNNYIFQFKKLVGNPSVVSAYKVFKRNVTAQAFEENTVVISSDNVKNPRSATLDEIELVLMKEAEESGAKIGESFIYDGFKYKISKLEFIHPGNKENYSVLIREQEEDYFIAITYFYGDLKEPECNIPISKAKLIKYPDISINGHKAVFFEDHVKFGCATINKDIFLLLKKAIKIESDKKIEEIKIGSGVFQAKTIEVIAEYFENIK